MKYFLLLTLLFLCFLSNLSAQTEVLEVTDATKVDNLSVERFMSPCRYEDTYIINEKYVVYQSCTSRKQFSAFEIPHDLELTAGIVGRYGNDRGADRLAAVVQTETAGEELIAEGDKIKEIYPDFEMLDIKKFNYKTPYEKYEDITKSSLGFHVV